jgi:hypothetical protein
MTLELSLEINRKLQEVLEDTLLKNIMLKVKSSSHTSFQHGLSVPVSIRIQSVVSNMKVLYE